MFTAKNNIKDKPNSPWLRCVQFEADLIFVVVVVVFAASTAAADVGLQPIEMARAVNDYFLI